MSDSEKPLVLYTGRTPNGFKVTICIEELKAAYGAAGPDVEYVSSSALKFAGEWL